MVKRRWAEESYDKTRGSKARRTEEIKSDRRQSKEEMDRKKKPRLKLFDSKSGGEPVRRLL